MRRATGLGLPAGGRRAIAAGLFAALFAGIPAAALAASYTVVIQNFEFKPQTLKVKAGDTIQWVNKDILDHTATAGNNAFDSKDIRPNATWRWVAAKPGQYAYICSFHPNMTGVIDVE